VLRPMTCEVPISKTDQLCGPAVPKFTELVDALPTLVGALLALLADVLLALLADVLLALLVDVLLTLLASALLTLLAGAVLTLLAGALLTLLAGAVLTLLAGALLTLLSLSKARLPPVGAKLPSAAAVERAINGPEPKKKPLITARLTKALFLIHELTRAALFIFNLSFTPDSAFASTQT
jgi:hypothetical protein